MRSELAGWFRTYMFPFSFFASVHQKDETALFWFHVILTLTFLLHLINTWLKLTVIQQLYSWSKRDLVFPQGKITRGTKFSHDIQIYSSLSERELSAVIYSVWEYRDCMEGYHTHCMVEWEWPMPVYTRRWDSDLLEGDNGSWLTLESWLTLDCEHAKQGSGRCVSFGVSVRNHMGKKTLSMIFYQASVCVFTFCLQSEYLI